MTDHAAAVQIAAENELARLGFDPLAARALARAGRLCEPGTTERLAALEKVAEAAHALYWATKNATASNVYAAADRVGAALDAVPAGETALHEDDDPDEVERQHRELDRRREQLRP